MVAKPRVVEVPALALRRGKPGILRRMSPPRRVVSRTLTLSCAMIGAAAPLACQQVQDMIGKKDTPATTVVTDVPTPVVAPPAVPIVAPPIPGTATLESLLALVHGNSTGAYAVLRQPTALLDLGDEAIKFYDGPVQALVGLLGMPEIAAGFGTAKTGLGELRGKLSTSGVDLSRGVVVTQAGPGSASTVIVVAAAQADQVKGLMTALNVPGADKTVCKAIDTAPGYIGCADSEAVLAAYKPGDGAARRVAAEARLPGVPLDELTVLGYSPDDGGVHVALAMPPGAGVLHVGLASESAETKDALAVFEPGPPTALRFARPGTGFMWARTDVAEMKRRTPDLASAPPPFDAALATWNGELFFGGSSDPAALQLRLGLSETTAVTKAIEATAKTFGGSVPKTIPGMTGSKVAFDTRDLTFASGTAKAAHVTVTGIEQASVLSHVLGLSLDVWVFAADNSLAVAVGADPTAISRLTELNSELTLASLPAAAAEDLRAGRAGFVMHVPLDTLQSPQLRKGLEAAFKNVPQFKPEQARTAMAMISPLSTGTLWITEHSGAGVVHMAIQGIGHTHDEEGKAALAAAVAVAGGGDPAALFGDLVTRFPASPRLAAYQARAGTTGAGALTGSMVGGVVLAGAILWTEVTGTANKELAAELGVPAKVEAPKVEAPKVETPKVETPKVDPPKADPPKVDPPKSLPKADPPKVDPPRSLPKADPPKADPPKTGEIKVPPKRVPRDASK